MPVAGAVIEPHGCCPAALFPPCRPGDPPQLPQPQGASGPDGTLTHLKQRPKAKLCSMVTEKKKKRWKVRKPHRNVLLYEHSVSKTEWFWKVFVCLTLSKNSQNRAFGLLSFWSMLYSLCNINFLAFKMSIPLTSDGSSKWSIRIKPHSQAIH